ncbi:U1 small nuclear ribonucleo protein of 70kDa MW N terminal-domain-containing protein [Aspergillus pseudonomiae]|uniref:U1 small nuclear ribonucleo protein of 70kDa MW N terminal-domain-containing protein n=2 Tax=Aspergillus subgen. Circumdati TaxID=2720871 RepID=A0A5N6I6E0_9EURO|nr:U1 small nuclear ribonucleoprotein of 70kDa MW N terminal-domain-containing protein [Aspergillus pseudonomiae]KAB8261734.1 U1 small nuclear ribonucleo protein of 70kDa MW N terminal-domain-containing protein [Aspergillus pseudonomiae]KAE8398383.1 U1 small nuclear ribonucleo protein of 70kDa MW N terminal-domain-containing protein [Aspergillus pseudonomiae]
MTDKLPPPLLALFQPRPPLRYVTPIDRAPEDCKKSTLGGVAQFLPDLKEYEEEYPYNATESWIQRKLRQKQEKKENIEKHLTDGIHTFDPANDPQARGDPFKTLFVSRLSYDVKESDLEREFGRFGPIERIRIVKDTVTPKGSKKPHKGYAFIVYEREKDMKAAYKETDGIRIKDRRVLVDVERGRTVKGWKPRRFGGGLGGRGYTKALPSRPIGPGSFGAPSGPGGYGGGFRGGFGGGRGRGGFRNERFGGPRGGVGYQGGRNGFGGGGQAPPNAPSGPGGGRSGGFGGRFGDRDRGATGSNREPIRPRDGFSERDRRDDRDRDGGDRHRDRDRDSYRYRDRDRERERGDRGDRGGDRYGGREDYGRKRYHEDDAYDDPRAKRRY